MFLTDYNVGGSCAERCRLPQIIFFVVVLNGLDSSWLRNDPIAAFYLPFTVDTPLVV